MEVLETESDEDCVIVMDNHEDKISHVSKVNTMLPGLEKTRVFLKKTQPSGFFWVFLGFLGFFGFFWVFLGLFAQTRGFLGFLFQFHEYFYNHSY